MQPITEQQRIETYRTAPEEIRALYVHDELTALVSSLYEKFAIAQPYKMFSQIVGDTILGFNKISDMPRLFQQRLNVGADDSQRMVSQLIELLEPVIKREEEEAKNKKAELGKLADTFAKPENIITPTQNTQTAPSEVVEPIRTMAQDMNRVHGYGAYREKEEQEVTATSSQTDLLKKKDPETPL